MAKKKQPPFLFRKGVFQHRDAIGSKLRRKVDALCRDLTDSELEIIRRNWKDRADHEKDSQLRREYKTCLKIIIDYKELKKHQRIIREHEWIEKELSHEYSWNYNRLSTRDEDGNIIDSE